MYKRDASQVATLAPDGTDKRYLGALGDVSGLTYSYVLSGGCDQMSCDLLRTPGPKPRALESGRIVAIERGASRVWDGKLTWQPSGRLVGRRAHNRGGWRHPGLLPEHLHPGRR
jgi:hypothetical protein